MFRADELLVKRGLVETRSKARLLILEKRVTYRNGEPVEKPGKKLDEATELVVTKPMRYVSRGGDKLEHFLTRFKIDVADKHCLDIGASTGGFTDCLLQHGAATATCVDVGHDQLHTKLSGDPRVSNVAGVNARDLEKLTLPHTTYPLVVIDLSFISLNLVLPAIWPRVADHGVMIALIKPQFEVSRQEAYKRRGVIQDSTIHRQVIAQVEANIASLPGSTIMKSCIESPIKGGDGNTEFLIGVKKAPFQIRQPRACE